VLAVIISQNIRNNAATAPEMRPFRPLARLRPILMTSFAFIFGVVPLMIATGAGAEMRQALGTAVFFGLLGVTAFGPRVLRARAPFRDNAWSNKNSQDPRTLA
jgi:hydrophobic/amphiphilic exporter-1 (mainly G- bacteria), HAE1 family